MGVVAPVVEPAEGVSLHLTVNYVFAIVITLRSHSLYWGVSSPVEKPLYPKIDSLNDSPFHVSYYGANWVHFRCKYPTAL
jgi:hypothetical protein